MSPAAFLDRDGVLMEDRGYVSRPEDVCLLAGTGAALRRLKRAGYLLIVVTNQSGIGRGLFDEGALREVHRQLAALLATEDVVLDAIFHCPHAPAAGCACRKPLPGLLYQATGQFPIDLARSFMVGDKPSDVAAGTAADVGRSYLIGSPEFPDLAACVAAQLATLRVSG